MVFLKFQTSKKKKKNIKVICIKKIETSFFLSSHDGKQSCQIGLDCYFFPQLNGILTPED